MAPGTRPPAKPDGPRRSRGPLVALVGLIAIVVVGGIVVVAMLGGTTIKTQGAIVNSSVGAAQDRAAQSNLSTEATAVRSLYISSNETYATITPSQAMSAEPTLQVVSGAQPSTGPSTISLAVGDQSFVIAARSASGTCWFNFVNNSATATPAVPGLPSGSGTLFGSAHLAGACTADTAPSVQNWSRQFPISG